jgi:hypothetical protein
MLYSLTQQTFVRAAARATTAHALNDMLRLLQQCFQSHMIVAALSRSTSAARHSTANRFDCIIGATTANYYY